MTIKLHWGEEAQEKKEEESYPTKRICESGCDDELELELFQECPTCKSKSFHKVLKFINNKWK